MKYEGINARGRVLIIGYGNPLRADDGLGWQAADRLAAGLKDAPVEALAVHQLTPELGESIRDAGLVIFIDAAHEGQPGTWTCAPVQPDMTPCPSLAHHLTPGRLLAYAQALFDASPPALVISVTGASFGYGEKPSRRVEAVLPGALRHARARILAQIRAWHE
jgi:hydrogenase maturation protease